MSDTGGVDRDDPGLVALAAELAALADAAERHPFVVGLVGSVAVGKTTTAQVLAALLTEAAPIGEDVVVEVVATDAFLLPNEQLDPLGGAMVKGYPQSYDWQALQRFLGDAASGAPVLATPIYSHAVFDIVPGAQHVMAAPDVLIVEGLNLLQGPPAAPVDLREHLDHTIYLHADPPVLEAWFVERFVSTTRAEASSPESFYAMFADMDDAEVESVARWTWSEINAPNLHQHIAPTMERAHVVVHKAPNHSIERIQHQRR